MIVGCGTVGGAAATILTRDRKLLEERCGARIELRHVVDVDFTHAQQLGLDKKLFRTDLALKSSAGDPRVLLERLVVELCERKAPRA